MLVVGNFHFTSDIPSHMHPLCFRKPFTFIRWCNIAVCNKYITKAIKTVHMQELNVEEMAPFQSYLLKIIIPFFMAYGFGIGMALANLLQRILNLLISSFPPSGFRAIPNCSFAWRNPHRLNLESGTGCTDVKRKLGIWKLKRMAALCKLKAGNYKTALEVIMVLSPEASWEP